MYLYIHICTCISDTVSISVPRCVYPRANITTQIARAHGSTTGDYVCFTTRGKTVATFGSLAGVYV